MPHSAFVNLPIAVGGIDTEREPTSVGPFSPYMLNAIVEPDKVRKRLGYAQLGGNLPLSGTGGELVGYTDARGTTHLIALTTTKAYHYNDSTDAWDDITPVAGSFTGGVDNIWAHCLATDVNEFTNNGGTVQLISNDVDDVQYFEGDSNDKFEVLVHAYPSFANTKAMEEFWNHLIFLNYNNGANNVRSLLWFDIGDVDDSSGGTSGGTTLTDSIGEILRAAKLGSDMIIYSALSISTCRYRGGSIVFVIPTLIYAAGLLSERSLVPLNRMHFFLGSDEQSYAYSGSRQLIPIGMQIDRWIFANLDISKKARVVGGHDSKNHKAIFAIPRSSDTYARAIFAYNYQFEAHPWEYWELADTVRGFANFTSQYAWYCDDTRWKDQYCDEVSLYCDASEGQTGYPTLCFISDDGYVYKLDDADGQDDDADIVFEYQTLDATVDAEEHKGRWEWASITARAEIAGSTMSVHHSTDGGKSWTELADSPKSLTSSWATYRLPMDVVSRRCRVKLYQNSSGDIQLRGNVRLEVVPQPARD